MMDNRLWAATLTALASGCASPAPRNPHDGAASDRAASDGGGEERDAPLDESRNVAGDSAAAFDTVEDTRTSGDAGATDAPGGPDAPFDTVEDARASADTGASDAADASDAATDAGESCASGTLCGTACVDTATSLAHCGGCGARCAIANAVPSCAAGRCAIDVCVAGFADCDGELTSGCEVDLRSDPRNCGVCGTPCSVAHGVGACVDRGCRVARCDDGFVVVGGGCAEVLPPRLVAPLSAAIVTSQQPLLRWSLASGSDGARIEICRDRGCAMVAARFDVVGDRGAPSAPLAPGVYFWRARGRSGGTVGAAASAHTWEFFVGRRTSLANSSLGTFADFNGDGLSDLALGVLGTSESDPGRVYVYRGGGGWDLSGAVPTPVIIDNPSLLGTDRIFGQQLAAADFNADGFSDLAVGTSSRRVIWVFFGSPTGLQTAAASRLAVRPNDGDASFVYGLAAGDVNGDGWGDLVSGGVGASSRLYTYEGREGGLATSPTTTAAAPVGLGASAVFAASLATVGDFDLDGYGDVLVGSPSGTSSIDGAASIYYGAPAGRTWSRVETIPNRSGLQNFGLGVAGGDVDGDGAAELFVGARGVDEGQAVNPPRPTHTRGGAWAYRGAPGATLVGARVTELCCSEPGDAFGTSISVDDVNGDGFHDVFVTADSYGGFYGRVLVYAGSAAGVPAMPTLIRLSTASTATHREYFGVSSVGVPGDLDGDGFNEVLVKGFLRPDARLGFGIFRGGSPWSFSSPTWTFDNPTPWRFFGLVIASRDVAHPSDRQDTQGWWGRRRTAEPAQASMHTVRSRT